MRNESIALFQPKLCFLLPKIASDRTFHKVFTQLNCTQNALAMTKLNFFALVSNKKKFINLFKNWDSFPKLSVKLAKLLRMQFLRPVFFAIC